ncbi:hypothetical protein E6O75_ATG10187 [Venturia nashicola]|uniref:CENP-V/GFA domain-containing protein n=1 Tax=Venturia nashicola TaxID=86259 RepID=A0A4Z1NFR6_9PEZI|nr:hypothetical protein E6O75_ATG10187 [Venturia nashicola]
MAPFNGTCNCGAISTESPKMPDICVKGHCQSCRVSSGGLFSAIFPVLMKDMTIHGKPKVYVDRDTTPGKPVNHNFCADCGCTILSTTESENHETGYVKGGLFTKAGFALPPPGAEIFWHRREKWEKPTEGVERQ